MKPCLAIAGLGAASFILLFLFYFVPDFYVMLGSGPGSWKKSTALSLEERLIFSFIAASIIAAVTALVAGLFYFAQRVPLWRKRSANFCTAGAVILALGMCGYLLTFGHCFLPLPSVHSFQNERIEMRIYPPGFEHPDESSSALTRAVWVLTRPGQARLLGAAKRLAQANPEPRSRGLYMTLKDLGYPFPQGCGARNGGDPPDWKIVHYPAILARFEKDLHLGAGYRVALGVDGGPLPNQQNGGAGEHPSPSEVDRTSVGGVRP